MRRSWILLERMRGARPSRARVHLAPAGLITACCAVFVAVRAFTAARCHDLLTTEITDFGMMPRHLLDGFIAPLSAYMPLMREGGSLIFGVVCAPVFAVLGPSVFALRMANVVWHAMVLAVIGHMARVFYAGAYRPPREFNWVVGVLLLVLTLFLSFTGYLLPWDQLAYWAITVGTNMAGATPILGHAGPFAIVGPDNDVRFLLLGDTTVSEAALLRFYVLHCVILPFVVAVLSAIHFYRVRKDGGVLAREKEGHDEQT